jgi:pyrimidine-nucleoside phosphorylase
MGMTAYEIIKKKRDGRRLDAAEIEFLIASFMKGETSDYQIVAFLMAVYFRGLSGRETTLLTENIMNSGELFDLSSVPGIKVDKHSTGGVGDKVSLLVAPLVASCGVPVPMVSGRGLGHTGGTLDKLESIPGFRTRLTPDEFRGQLERIGVAMMGQTDRMAPADGRIYALRDVTATVDSMPLIAASIMSKKLAEGTDALVLDVKTGRGAFMQRRKDAADLARTMVRIGREMGKTMVALITSMEQPLGQAIGNSVEVEESIRALKGEGPPDLLEVTLALGAEMLMAGRKAKGIPQARAMLEGQLRNGQALEKFRQMVSAQGGDGRVTEDPGLLPRAGELVPIQAARSGFVERIDCLEVGLAAVDLGAGRTTAASPIDPAVGIILHHKVGERVKRGEVLATVLAGNQEKGNRAAVRIRNAYTIGPRRRRIQIILDRL